MAIADESSLRRTLAVAAGSRLAALTLAVGFDYLLPDHVPEGALTVTFDGCNSTAFTRAFTRWDSAHFLAVAADGWEVNEYSHAFFPLYPILVRRLAELLAWPHLVACATELRVVAGLLVSNFCFLVAACCLHALGDRVLRDPVLARTAALLFCASPATVFFSTLYSESTFAAATFGGLLLLEQGLPWSAATALGLATACRANGLLHALPLAHYGLRRLAALIEQQTTPVRGRGGEAARPLRAADRLGAALSLASAVCALVLQVCLVVAPYIGWQLAGYWRVCPGAETAAAARSSPWAKRGVRSGGAALAVPTPTRHAQQWTSTLPAGWCTQRLPDLYSHVQQSYWGVGFLSYYELRQLPNFALAAPAIALCVAGCCTSLLLANARYGCWTWRELGRGVLGLRPRGLRGSDGDDSESRPITPDGAATPRALLLVIEWSALSALVLLFGNVQIVTRLVSAACPPFYWYMAHLVLLRGTPPLPARAPELGGRSFGSWLGRGSSCGRGWLGSSRLRTSLLAYLGMFGVVGTALHSNSYPWT